MNISDDDDGRGHELHVRLPFQYFLDVVADARDLALAQRLVELATPPRVLLLTCGTLAVDASHAASDAAHGGAWGFARVLRLEHAALRTQSTDVSRGVSAASAISIASHAEAEAARMRDD